MKILSIAPTYWPAVNLGGIPVSVHSLNKALVKKGVNVSVYTSNTGLNGKVRVNHEVNINEVNVTYFRTSTLFDLAGNTGWQFSRGMTTAVKESIKKYDLVHINGIWSYPTAMAAHFCRKFEKPYIISPHGMLFTYTISKKWWKKWPYYTLVLNKGIRNADALHFLTDHEKNGAHQSIAISNNSFTVPVGVETSDFDQLSSTSDIRNRYPELMNKKIILFVGRINWKKGLDILTSAFSRLMRTRKDIRLLVVGPDEGGYVKKVKTWIKEKGISKNVTLTGILKDRQKAEAFKGSDIFVLPSYSEALSTSILEAMYCGLPVIVSDQSDFPEITQYNAGIVTPCDHTNFSRAMEELLNDEGKRKLLGENGRRLVIEKFSWDMIADEMIERYQQIIEEHKIPFNYQQSRK